MSFTIKHVILHLLFILFTVKVFAQTIIRGPYMNLATQTGIIIRWKTDVATDSKVSFGTTKDNLNKSVIVDLVTNEHIVQLTGLAANTKYFYSVGTTGQALQGDANNYFKTAPSAASNQKIRILAMGDMGNNSTNQINVRNAYLKYNGTNYTDIWMLLGDNAYEKGTESNYNTNFFNIYQQNLSKNHVLWPAPGNHDYADYAARQADHNIAYYSIFSLPSAGEAGGVASNTEAYYSYNYGNTHFVSLDSYGWETGNTRLYDTLGPQVTWLKRDLASNNRQWTVVYFHHPPYTKGSHNSDSETELIKMRQNLVRILERYNVDLVLSGHSHSYERSYLINGHYGLENTFSLAGAVSASSGKYNGSANSCPYIKNSSEVRNGIVFAVAGSSGKLGGTSSGYPHQAMHYSNVTIGGALVIEIDNNRLDAKWVCSDGVIRDNFTIVKQVNKKTDTTIAQGSNITLTASWAGNYIWSTGETTRTLNVTPSTNASYIVRDNFNCLADTFNVTISETTAATQTLGALADAHIRNGSYAGANYGSDTSLIVKSSTYSEYSRRAYLKFSLDSVKSVKRAILRLYGKNTENLAYINIAAFGVINDSWTEKGITWNNAPAALTLSLSSVSVNDQAKYYEFDVTNFVKEQFAGDKIVSFLIKDTANQNRNIAFKSRQNVNNRPQLVIRSDSVTPNFSQPAVRSAMPAEMSAARAFQR